MSNPERVPLIDSNKTAPALESMEAVFSWSHVKAKTIVKRTLADRITRKPPKQERVLLEDVSGVAVPGQIVAIMGASGVGKTTLLKALSGQQDTGTTAITGDFYLNGHPAPRSQRLNSSVIGYVEQHELFLETMSAEEHLIFQAMLRMKNSIRDRDRRIAVRDIMTRVSLSRSADTTISRLSGGERKRLAFATVFLTQPPVILIDEPTSGLDAHLAKTLMKTVRKMAVEYHRTIIVVLHHVTSEIYATIDSLCLMAHGGRQAFFGDKDSAVTFFSTECGLSALSLDEYIEQIAEAPEASDIAASHGTLVADHFEKSSHLEAVHQTIAALHGQPGNKINGEEVEQWNSSFCRQLKWIGWRTCIGYWRNVRSLIKSMCLLLGGALFLGLVFLQLKPSKPGYEQNLNAISIFMLFLLMTNNMSMPVLEIPSERARIIREYKRHTYSLTAYYMIRLISSTIYAVVSAVLYMAILIPLVSLHRSILLIGIVAITVLSAWATAAFLGAIVSNASVGILVLQPLQMILMQFSGYFINLHSIPVFVRWAQYLSFFYYSYSLILITQWHDISCGPKLIHEIFPNVTRSVDVCAKYGEEVLNYYAVDAEHFGFYLWMLIVLTALLNISAFVLIVIRIRYAIWKTG